MFFCLLFWGFFGFFVCLLFYGSFCLHFVFLFIWFFVFYFCLISDFSFLFWLGGEGVSFLFFGDFLVFFLCFFFTISKNLLDLLKSPILNIKRTLNKNLATPAIDTEKVRGSIFLYAKKIMLLECFVFMSNFH